MKGFIDAKLALFAETDGFFHNCEKAEHKKDEYQARFYKGKF
jgi:hypothetical protein